MTDPADRNPRRSRATRGPTTANARLRTLLTVLLTCLFASWGGAFAQITVDDDLGREVRLDRPAGRVVSMIPSHTETVCALSACDLLVGRDTFGNVPERVASLYGESAATLAAGPGWSDLRALRDGRVVELTQDQVDLLNRAGPRLPEALELLIELLHPELP